MHRIEPARLKPGASIDRLPSADTAAAASTSGNGAMIRGRALIVWDPKRPGEKLDAIDTDQITPAADCVSESLEELDKRWKEGAFRYLVPDFRERVHSGRTFLIAGDRFAIGSSREMSPAGLKAVARMQIASEELEVQADELEGRIHELGPFAGEVGSVR